MSDAATAFHLEITPTLDDWTRAVRARQDVAGVAWTHVAGAVAVVLAVIVFALNRMAYADLTRFDVLSPAALGAVGLLIWTGTFDKVALRMWIRGNPRTTEIGAVTLTDEGLVATGSGMEQRVAWASFQSVLVLPDQILLLTGKGRDSGLFFLVRRGLSDPTQWPDLVAFVTRRVPTHPRTAHLRA